MCVASIVGVMRELDRECSLWIDNAWKLIMHRSNRVGSGHCQVSNVVIQNRIGRRLGISPSVHR